MHATIITFLGITFPAITIRYCAMLLKLKLTPAIYLAGFMGSGKSSVGRALAGELGWSFYDLDEEVERRAGQNIPAIFAEKGESVFRALETEALAQRVAQARTGRPQVVALGGGTFTNDHNIKLASDNGVTIWLDTPIEVIEQRIATETHRPLAHDREQFRALFVARQTAYCRADYRIETGARNPGEVVAQVLALPIFVP